MFLVVRAHAPVDLCTRHAGNDRGERDILQRDHVVEHALLLVARRPDHHRSLELGVIAPHRRGRARYEHVAGFEDNVVRQRVGDCRVAADLAAVARDGAGVPEALPAVEGTDRVEHRRRRLCRGAVLDLRLGDTGTRVALQQSVREVPPLAALAQQRELGLALDRHLILDDIRDRRRRSRNEVGQRRPAIAEHPRVAVVVGAEPSANPESREELDERLHRMPLTGELIVVCDLGHRGVRLRVLELESRHEHAPRKSVEIANAIGRSVGMKAKPV